MSARKANGASGAERCRAVPALVLRCHVRGASAYRARHLALLAFHTSWGDERCQPKGASSSPRPQPRERHAVGLSSLPRLLRQFVTLEARAERPPAREARPTKAERPRCKARCRGERSGRTCRAPVASYPDGRLMTVCRCHGAAAALANLALGAARREARARAAASEPAQPAELVPDVPASVDEPADIHPEPAEPAAPKGD